MPKETKKFINPLLRPSQQEIEPKQEKSLKQEKSAAVTTAPANRSQPARRTEEQEEKSKQTPPDSLRQPPVERESDAALANKNLTQSRTPKTTKHSDDSDPQNAPGQESSVPLEERSSTQTYEPQPETLRAQTDQPLIRSETPSSYDARVSNRVETEAPVTDAKQNHETQEVPDGDESDDSSYEPEVDFSVTTTKARRKRGEQAFERTHVRFTVWVDKNLKQSFEDIATQRDKPKATLLNEAIADLVRKYEAP